MTSLHTDNSSSLTELPTSASSHVSPSSFFTLNELYLITTALVLVSVIGTFQNLMVVGAIFFSRNRLLEIPSSWFVLSLATADLFVCSVSVPLYMVHLHLFFWQPFLAFGQFTTLISSGSLVLLTFNRFLSIYDTLGYIKIMTVIRAKFLAAGMWLLAITLTVITTLAKIYNADYLVFLSIGYYVIINILTAGFHFYMFRVSCIKTKAIRKQRLVVLSGQQRNAIQEYNHLFRLLLIVGTYIITWVPFAATLSSTPDNVGRRSPSFQRQFALFYTLLSTNSAIDPFLYFLRSEEFKMFTQKFNRIFHRRRPHVEPRAQSFHIYGRSSFWCIRSTFSDPCLKNKKEFLNVLPKRTFCSVGRMERILNLFQSLTRLVAQVIKNVFLK